MKILLNDLIVRIKCSPKRLSKCKKRAFGMSIKLFKQAVITFMYTQFVFPSQSSDFIELCQMNRQFLIHNAKSLMDYAN